MLFQVVKRGFFPSEGKDRFYLYQDMWDDFSYKTTFFAIYYDINGKRHDIGPLKIGRVGMRQGAIIDTMPLGTMPSLPDEFLSLGQSDSYYENLNQLGSDVRETVLTLLHDLAYNTQLFEEVRREDVVRFSLLRDVSPYMVQNQLHRIAHGGARLTEFDFTYITTSQSTAFTRFAKLDFHVIPDSNPPSNIHVLIGRNGIGKTHLLRNMIQSIRFGDNDFGYFQYSSNPLIHCQPFANVLCIAFSPFDDFPPTSEENEIPYTYIGLDKKATDLIKSLEEQFYTRLLSCLRNMAKTDRLIKTMEILKTDPAFDQSNIDFLIRNFKKDDTLSEEDENSIKSVFSSLSSGHKVTLLIAVSCVDKLEEKSILFLDEPENHLHPPLFSAFIRALSYLLIDRNGVAIVSTHSPVILQEVPRMCVWALRRSEAGLIPERLDIETFGANIGTLTNQVFGLEVTESGFHKMLKDAVEKYDDYEQILESFHGKLGDEAKGILRTLLAIKKIEGEYL